MSNKIAIDRLLLNKVKYAVRASQAVVQYGVGSMVDFPDQTLMPAAPEQWDDSVMTIHDGRLEKLLHVHYFGMPGSKDEKQYFKGVSYARFPEWYFCPKCRRIQPLTAWIREFRKHQSKKAESNPYMVRSPHCARDNTALVTARIVTVCEDGHIDDFPWEKWPHAKVGKPVCANPVIRLFTSPTATEGLEGIQVRCDTCGAHASLAGAFNKDSLHKLEEYCGGACGFRCRGRHPWKNTQETCLKYPHVIQRGASSVYFPVVETSLVIPPFSSKITGAVENCPKYRDLLNAIDSILAEYEDEGILTPERKQKTINKQIDKYVNSIATSILIGEEQVRIILERNLMSQDESDAGEDETDDPQTTGSLKYRIEEYEALSSESPDIVQDGDFRKELVDVTDYKLPYVRSVSLIHKIREVQAMIGFTRLKPIDPESANQNSKGPKIVCIKDSKTDWYPAYQVRGEGIFIEFDSVAIEEFVKNKPEIVERASHIDSAYRSASKTQNKKSAKYVMLHTLSHLLIKQLSFECGYGISSLKERIFCSTEAEGKEMAGILIYTASGDSEGTLGGLVRQGRQDCFPAIFRKALEAAIICSNDPVCSLSKGQGRESVNLAACYSCALIPETSCERSNLCLDRGMLIGTFANRSMGLYSPQLFEGKPWEATDVVWDGEKTAVSSSSSSEPTGMPIPEPQQVSEPQHVLETVTLEMTKPGMDCKSARYSAIWKQYLDFASDTEKPMLEKLFAESSKFEKLEKPFQNTEFQNAADGMEIQCDLRWEKAHVLFFTDEGEDDYEIAKKSDWKCVFTSDGVSAADTLYKYLGGK